MMYDVALGYPPNNPKSKISLSRYYCGIDHQS